MSQSQTLNEQINELIALYQNTDIKNQAQRQDLATKVNESGLPRYHKEAMLIAFLSKSAEEVTVSLHLMRQQEVLRHSDALMKIEQRVLGARLKRIAG